MKYFLLFLVLGIFSMGVYAQNDTTSFWTKSGDFSLNFNQISFNNWAAGGDNSLSGVALLNYGVDYDNGINSWKNKIILGYGLQYLKEDYTKTEDKIDLSSLFGHKIAPKWDIAMLAFFKSQFAKGYDGDNDSIPVSDFMAPAYIGIGPGLDYKPTDYFSIFMSPATAQWVIVNDQQLADEGAFGVTGAEFLLDVDGNVIAKNAETLTPLSQSRLGNWQKLPLYFGMKPWTDDFTNIIEIWK